MIGSAQRKAKGVQLEIEHVMRKSAVVDKIIKNGIRQLITDYPDKYYFKSYLGRSL